MAIPSKAVGYGNNNTARNVFRLAFSTALSTPPIYEAYDYNGGTFPALGSLLTVAQVAFAGTAGNANKPMLSLVDTSAAAPASAWKPAAATGGSANPNRMKGQTNYVTAAATPGAGGVITWNEVVEIPSDLVPATHNAGMIVELLVRYTYTGAAPVLTWTYNDGGTEAVPVWTALTPGTHGLRHAKAGAATPDYPATVPASGTQDTVEGWITV